MTPTVGALLNELPPYQDNWIVIHPNQSVRDIMTEVVNAHEEFAPYYDKIALYFDDSSVKKICDKVYSFIKRNIKYHEEPEETQTSALPTGVLTRGFGDCKHYSGFAAGVLDALKRTGRNIDWSYKFASYDPASKTPHHVFVEVRDHGETIWIDPTPGAREKTPWWLMDKKVKTSNMALMRNISGIGDIETAEMPLDVDQYLAEADLEGDEEISDDEIAKIKLLLSYNVLDIDGNFHDDVLQQLATTMPAEDFKAISDARFSVGNQIIGGLFKKIFRGIKKVTLAVPRNAYLSLVALNVFGLATKLKQAFQTKDGQDRISDKWYKLGGNPDKLRNAVEHGSKKKKILGVSIGAAPALPVWVAAATAIIAALKPIIDSVLRSQQQQNVPMIEGYDPSLLNTSEMGGSGIFDWIKNNPIPVAMGGLGLFLLLNKKKKTVTGIDETLPFILIGGGLLFFIMKNKYTASAGSDLNKRQAVLNWNTQHGGDISFASIVSSMSDSEINAVYDYLYNYIDKGTRPAEGSYLYNQIQTISSKYNIFT
jgi:hypothetical protein